MLRGVRPCRIHPSNFQERVMSAAAGFVTSLTNLNAILCVDNEFAMQSIDLNSFSMDLIAAFTYCIWDDERVTKIGATSNGRNRIQYGYQNLTIPPVAVFDLDRCDPRQDERMRYISVEIARMFALEELPRSMEDVALPAFLGAVEQSLPHFLGDEGIFPQLATTLQEGRL